MVAVAAINPTSTLATIGRSDLRKVISTLNRIADRKSSIAILGGACVKTDHTSTQFVATDLNLWMTFKTEALSAVQGSAVVKVKSLADMLAKMPEGQVSIAREDGAHIRLVGGGASVHVDGFLAQDFPKVPDTRELTWVRVDGSDLAACITRVISHVCLDETRFHLNGISFQSPNGKSLTTVATDGHRLAYSKSSYDDAWQIFRSAMIIPAKACSEIVRMLGKKPGVCEIARKDHMLHVRYGAWELSCKAIDAQFPPWEQVMPKSNEHAAAVDLGSLRSACERSMAILGKRAVSGMRIQRFNDSPMLRLTTEYDGQRISEEIPGSLGDAFVVGVNPRYLLDALEHMESRTSTIELVVGKELDPVLVFSHDEEARSDVTGKRHAAVVMPMRI